MIVTVSVVGGASVGGASTARAQSSPSECPLVSTAELERVLGVAYDAQPPVGPSCLFLSASGARSSIVTAFSEARDASAIAEGKRQLRKEPGAKVLRGVGDAAFVVTEPVTDTSGDATRDVVVFQDDQFGTLAVTMSIEAPTTKQLRRLAKILVSNL